MVNVTVVDKATYIEDFTQKCYELSKTKLNRAPKSHVINQQVTDMIDEYYSVIEAYPKSLALSYLANYILINELKSKDVDKVSNNEFPILSDIQIKRRDRKQTPMQVETIDFLNTKFNKHIDSLAKKTVKKVEY